MKFIADLLVIRYAAVNDSLLACVHNDKRKMDCCVSSWRTMFLFHLFVSLDKILKSNLLKKNRRNVCKYKEANKVKAFLSCGKHSNQSMAYLKY